jgi:hypothetical protein
MQRRRRFKQVRSLEERLAEQAKKLREKARAVSGRVESGIP